MTIQQALQELADEVKEILRQRIAQYGVNPRAKGANTLQGSDLETSIEVNTTENGIALQIADYWEYVSKGWERNGHYPGTWHSFLENINEWVRKKNIRIGKLTQNQIVWYLNKKMIVEGRKIAPRPFMVFDEEGDLTVMIPELKDYIDIWFENLINAILEEVNNYFNT